MLQKLRDKWNMWCDEGIKLPYANDPVAKKPSITLLMLYVSTMLMFTSVILVHIKFDLILATIVSIMVWILSYIFYRVRKIDKVKFDLDDKSFEIDSGKEDNE